MIWTGGQIVPDHALSIPALDRTFEHGLGLFETFRTWNRRPTLLDRHLARLQRSAAALRLPLHLDSLPDAAAVANLLDADGRAGDALLRITMSGGLLESAGAVVWMRSAPLPPMIERAEVVCVAAGADSPLLRHKTLNYWARRLLYEEARDRGHDEALLVDPSGSALEGTRTNLFVVTADRVAGAGEGLLLVTPPRDAPILPGIMRGVVMERATQRGLEVIEHSIRLGDPDVVEVFLTNSARGIIPVGRVDDREFEAPGPVTRRIGDDVRSLLEAEGA